MLDPKFLRENIDLVRKGVARKKFQVDLDAVLAADEARRHAVAEFEVARSAQNAANKEMAAMPKGSPETKALASGSCSLPSPSSETSRRCARRWL